MHQRSYTQDDLRQALKKIITGKQPAFHLTPSVAVEEPISMTPIQEVFEEPLINLPPKIEETPVKTEPEPSVVEQALQNAKNRQKILEEELQKAERTKALLVDQLRHQGNKSTDIDLLKNENERLKTATKELIVEINSLKNKPAEKPALPLEDFDALKSHKARLEQELAEQKQRALRFMCDKKEIDEKILSLNNEKASILARARDLAQKNSALTESQRLLTLQLQEASSSLEEKNTLLTEKEALLHDLETQVHKGLREYEALKLSQESLHVQFEEREQHLKLLEQHLARRVKECAILSKQLEEENEKQAVLQKNNQAQLETITSLQNLLDQSRKTEEALRQELIAQAKIAQEELSTSEQKFETLLASWKNQGQELNTLKGLQARFVELEQLFGQFNQLFSKPIASFDSPTSQKEFFAPSSPQPRVARTLFE